MQAIQKNIQQSTRFKKRQTPSSINSRTLNLSTSQDRKFENQKTRKRATCIQSDTLPHVVGILKQSSAAKALADDQPELSLKVADLMANLLQSHPEFIDHQWTSIHQFSEMVDWLFKTFRRLIETEDEHVFLHFTEDTNEPSFYWIHVVKESYEYGNIVPYCWHSSMKDIDQQFYELSNTFLNVIHHQLNIPLWNNYENFMWLDELIYMQEHEKDEFEHQVEDPEAFSSDLKKWEKATNQLHEAIKKPISIQKFKKQLKDYQPTKQTSALYNWFSGAIPLIEGGFNYFDTMNGPILSQNNQDKYFGNGEVWPCDYCCILWDDEDQVGGKISEEACEQAANQGVVPFIQSIEVTPTRVKSTPDFSLFDQFYNWMSDGNNASRVLNSYIRNLKSS